MLISSTIVVPSRSRGVKVPATESRPPIMLPLPSCSISMFAVAPDCSMYISLSALYSAALVKNPAISNIFLFVFFISPKTPSVADVNEF